MKKILLLALLGVFLASPVVSYAEDTKSQRMTFKDVDSKRPFDNDTCNSMTTIGKCKK